MMSDKPINIYSPNDMRTLRDNIETVMKSTTDPLERASCRGVLWLLNRLIVEAERKE